MKPFQTQVAFFCVFVSTIFLSQALIAEESYERFTVRTWTYRDGTEATGKLITVSGPVATLRLEGQGTVRVPLEKLSVKDLNWLYEYHKRKKQLSFLPPQYRKPQVAAPESKPEPETSKPAEPMPEPKQPEKSMPAQPATEESYQPFTLREWTFKDGKQYRAKFLSLSNRKVHLQKEPVDLLQVSLDQLSQKDLDWVIEYHHRNKLQAFLPKEYQEPDTKNPLIGGGPPAKEPPVKIRMNNPIKPGENPLKTAQEKFQAQKEKHLEEMRAKAKALAKDDNPDVIKANTEIDPVLVAALRDLRVWTDKKGQKSEARFHDINGREVMFVGRGLGFIKVHLGTLSDEDLQLLREALKMHGRMAELPFVYRNDLDPDLPTMKLKQILRVNNHRQWTDLSGNKVGASYVKMEEGIVTLLITATGATQEFPYLNFSAEDQEFVQERLKTETPGNFFPENTAEVDLSLTPEEQKEEFRIWIDRNNRKIKGKFVRLAYGNSVAVINTGKKEELFITEFFSDPDLSLIKPRKQKEKKSTNQLASNSRGRSPFTDMMNRGQSGRNAFSGRETRSSQPGMSTMKWEFECPLCKKHFKADSPFAEQCPHCGLKRFESVYECRKCSRSFKSDEIDPFAIRCPYCNPKQREQRVARNAANNNGARGAFGNDFAESEKPNNSPKSAYEWGQYYGELTGRYFKVGFCIFLVLFGLFVVVKVLG